MTTHNFEIALANKEGNVQFVQLPILCDIVKPSCSFIASYLGELGYKLNGYAVQNITEQYCDADYIVALNEKNECACAIFSREKLGQTAQYLAFVDLSPL